MAGKNKTGLVYKIYSWLHKRRTGSTRGALSPQMVKRKPLQAFQTVGLKPGTLTKRVQSRGTEIQKAGRLIHTKRR